MHRFIKYTLLTSLLVSGWAAHSIGQKPTVNYEVVENGLSYEITERPKDYFRVYILLQDQVDLVALNQQFATLRASKHDRVVTVVQQLQQKARSTQTPVLELLQAASGVKKESIRPLWVTNAIFIEAQGAFLAELSRNPLVQRIEQEIVATVADAEASEASPPDFVPNGREPGLSVINAHKMWAMGYTGYGTKVMIIDTDVDPYHPALRTQFAFNEDPLAQVYTAETLGQICHPHATYVAGALVGLDRQTKDTIGVAFNAQWINGPGPLFDTEGERCKLDGNVLGLIENLQFALNPDKNSNTSDDVPDVVNNSWGTTGTFTLGDCNNTVYRNVFSSLNAAGISVIFAAGNEGPDAGTISLQPSFNFDPYVPFSVGAVNESNSIASFSSRGPSVCVDGPDKFEPEVVAPGTKIRTSSPNKKYETIQGTSFSAPYVSGAVLLLKEAFPNLIGRQINEALHKTARDLGAEGEDNVYGAGLIDIYAAYQYLVNNGHVPRPPTSAANDVVLANIKAKPNDCNRQIRLFLTVSNDGTETITKMGIVLRNADNNQLFGTSTWEGQLAPGEVTTFETDPVSALQGQYTVQAELQTANGRADLRRLNNKMKVKVNVTNAAAEPTINVFGKVACAGGTTVVSAASRLEGTIRWYDQAENGNILGEGPQLMLANLNQDTIIYGAVVTKEKVGLERADIGAATTLKQSAGLVFDCLAPFTLKSVKVYAEKTGPRIFQLKDADDQVQQLVVPITQTGENRVELNFRVSPGTDYQLLMTLGNELSVTTTETGFPHVIDNILRINRSTGTVSTFYAYFYDWEVEYDYACGRISVPVKVNRDGSAPTVQFSADKQLIEMGPDNRATVNFTDESNGLVSWFWSFGDGFTSSEQNPSYVYLQPGTYTVLLEGTDVNGCTNVAMTQIEVQSVTSTEAQRALDNQIRLAPNPAREQVWIDFTLEERQPVKVQVVDLLGRTLKTRVLGNIQQLREPLDIHDLPDGTYMIVFQVGEVQVGKRLVKIR